MIADWPSQMNPNTTAIVVIAPPTIASVDTYWPLERIHGQPVLAKLLAEIDSEAGNRASVFIIAEPCASDKIRRELVHAGDRIVNTERLDTLGGLVDFASVHNDVRTLLVLPAGAVIPLFALMAEELKMHYRERAHVTCPVEFPYGTLPDIVDTRALLALRSVHARPGNADRISAVFQAANSVALARGRAPFQISLFQPPPDLIASIERSPFRVVVEDERSRRAAELATLVDGPNAVRDEWESIRQFGVRAHGARLRPAFDLPLQKQTGRSVLLVTTYAGFSGAEESLFTLIANLNRSEVSPHVVLSVRSTLSEKLRAVSVPTCIAGCDLRGFTPDVIGFLCECARQCEARIVHVNGPPPASVVVACSRQDLPIVAHARVLYENGVPEGFHFVDRIVAITRAVRQRLIRGGIPVDKISTIYNAVDTTKFVPSEGTKMIHLRLGLPPHWRILLMVARVSEQKRQDLLISALALTLQKAPECAVVFVGEAYSHEVTYREQLDALARRNAVHDRVFFWGFEKQLPVLYQNSDALVLCCENEPFGRCVMEAAACGLPVIVPDQGGFTEVFQHEQDCLQYKTGSAEHLSSAIQRVFTEDGLRQRIVQGGLATARRLSVEQHVLSIQNLYREIWNGPLTKQTDRFAFDTSVNTHNRV